MAWRIILSRAVLVIAVGFISSCVCAQSILDTSPNAVPPKASAGRQRNSVPMGPPLRPANTAWVESTLAAMTLDEKIGQMIMPSYSSGTADSMVTTYRVGGFIFVGNTNTAAGLVAATNHLQQISPVPLLFSIDCEAGLGARCVDATKFPMNMGSGAADRPDLASQQGGVTARECRAVGIHIGFGPVLDVNTEPVNPIIGIRAYGDTPDRVARLAAAYVTGANAEGLLCTYKHFPGHGPTTGDSHSGLQTVTIPQSELDSVHLAPYSTLFASGTVDLVMSAHVWYTCLDPGATPWPATLSTNALTNVLRTQLGYSGCVISDAYGMEGLLQAANNSTYDAVRLGVVAGLDIVLMPNSVADARQSLRDAVAGGTLTVPRIDDSVRRILTLKSRAGMPENTTVSETAYTGILMHPDNLAVAHEIGIRTITARDVQAADLPLTTQQSVLVYNLDTDNTIFYRYPSTYFNTELLSHLPAATIQSVATSLSASQINTLANGALAYDRVVVASYEWKPTVYTSQDTLVKRLLSQGSRVIYCSFGSPYQYFEFPGIQNFLCAYSTHYDSQQEMARVLVGLGSPQGEWPVSVPVGLSGFAVE